jgi:hypothetical protein
MGDAGDARATVAIEIDGGRELVIGRVDACAPDLGLVDVLARWHLSAQRRGWEMRLRDVSEELRGLLELVGLADALALEPRRKPELGEQLGEEEVVQSGDPPA